MAPLRRALLDLDAALAGLEPSQRLAVVADEPVVCVLAGAGTGKTRVLTLRVARRIEDGSAAPSRVLVCTFSRKAAAELRDRLWLLGLDERLQAGTFHRAALRLITRHRADRGLPAPPVLASRRRLLSEVTATGTGRLDAEIGWAKARLVAPDGYEEAARAARRSPPAGARRVADLYGRYEELRRRRGVLDLDDLIWHCVELLEEDPGFAAGVRWWHRHLFVDETQDLNESQYRLLRLLVGDDPDLFVVGDPDQSVYGWNGADPGLLSRIAEDFEGTRVVRLDVNHRCSPQVARAASGALGEHERLPRSTRPDGPLPRVAAHTTDADEARWVAREVWLAHRPGRRWSSIAVLARTNAQLLPIAEALGAEHVPCRLAGAELAPASDVSAGRDAGGERVPAHATGPTGPGTPDGVPSSHEGGGTGGTPAEAPAEERDAVVLSSFHRGKGLQWPAVFVVGLSEGFVPLVSARSRAAKAEERRLLYVALTRAEDELTCSWARFPDDASAVTGAGPRRPSPWLGAVEAAIAAETRHVEEAAPDRVREHLARMRTLLAEPGSPDAAPDGAAGVRVDG